MTAWNRAVALCVLAMLGMLMLTPQLQWLHLPAWFADAACQPPTYDGPGRCRPIAGLVNAIDRHLASRLTETGWPLPAVSLVWPLLYGLAPALLFPVLRDRLGPAAAWAGIALFLTSGGVLSAVFMKFTAAKPLGVVTGMLLLHGLDRLSRRTDGSGAGWLALLLIAAIAHPLTDETAAGILPALPLLVPESLRRGRGGLVAIAIGTVFAVLICQMILPHQRTTRDPYLGSPARMLALAAPHWPDLGLNYAWNMAAVVVQPLPASDQLARRLRPDTLAIFPAGEAEPLPGDLPMPAAGWLFAAGFASLCWLSTGLREAPRQTALLALVGLALSELARAMLVGRMGMGSGAFYQSSVAAIPYAVLGATLFAGRRNRTAGFCLLLLVAASIGNVADQSVAWRRAVAVKHQGNAGLPLDRD